MRINIVTQFSYCMETIIQAGNKRIPIASVRIKTNPKTRESRLFKSIWQHMYKSGIAIVRSFIMYKPHVIFMNLGLFLLIGGLVPFVRYACLLFFTDDRGAHLQSLLLGAVLLMAAVIAFALGVIADLIRTNRILMEDTLERLKELQYPKPTKREGADQGSGR